MSLRKLDSHNQLKFWGHDHEQYGYEDHEISRHAKIDLWDKYPSISDGIPCQ